MKANHLSLQYGDGVCTLILDRPPDNLLNIEMLEGLNDSLLQLRGRADIKVLVIQGAGEVFCGGTDFRDHTTPDRVQRMLNLLHRMFETIRLLEVIAVAAVNGKAVGSGFELALGCNLIVAAKSARFALPEVGIGVFPPAACVVLPRAAPRRKAMEWVLLGETVSAADLERHGVVNQVWPDDAFDAELDRFVGRLTRRSGPVLQLAKRAQLEAYYTTYEEALYKVENLYLRELMFLKDPKEGVQAFLEGREPKWVDA